MSNKLKQLFSEEGEKYTETITFNDFESYKAFGEALEKVYSTGQSQIIEGVKSIQSSLVDGDSKYPIDSEYSIIQVVIGLCADLIHWPVQVDNHTVNIEFYKKNSKNFIELTSVKKDIFDITITVYIKENKTVFKYNLYPEKAKNIIELIREYKTVKALIMSLFKNRTDIPEYKDMVSFFSHSICYLERLHELEQVLKINILPSETENEEDKDLVIEKLYLLLVKQKKIRSNDRLNFIKADVFGGNIGQEVFTAYTDKIGYNLFGQTITVYIVNSIFNAIVSEIDDVEDKSKKVYFSDTDAKPMYRVYSGFLSQKDAIEEQNNIRFKIQEYKEAKKIDEYLKDLIADNM